MQELTPPHRDCLLTLRNQRRRDANRIQLRRHCSVALALLYGGRIQAGAFVVEIYWHNSHRWRKCGLRELAASRNSNWCDFSTCTISLISLLFGNSITPHGRHRFSTELSADFGDRPDLYLIEADISLRQRRGEGSRRVNANSLQDYVDTDGGNALHPETLLLDITVPRSLSVTSTRGT
jgi:hypothetical protein